MKINMGSIDKAIRSFIAIIIAVLYFTDTVSGTFGIILLVISAFFFLTSFFGVCPLYTLIGINTCKHELN